MTETVPNTVPKIVPKIVPKAVTGGVTIRPCRRDDWEAFAENEYAMWRDIGAAPDQIKPDWREETLAFLAHASETARFRGYVAAVGTQIIGSAGGQLFGGLSPDILEPHHRRMGYIWGVYVQPEYRGQGIAQALTAELVRYLQSLGCTQVRLHASAAGQHVYEKLGFVPSTEMRLMLPGS